MAFSVNSLYRIYNAGLNPLQLVLVGTTLELSIFLFEVPTGVIADLISRRLSIIIGTILIGLATILEGLFPLFIAILAAQFMWGLGYTFTSGALQAWISDEIGEENAGSAFLHGAQYELIGSFVGVFFGTVIGRSGLNLPMIVSGAGFILVGIALIFLMPETNFHPQYLLSQRQIIPFAKMVWKFREGLSLVKVRPFLAPILAIGLVFGLYSEGFDRLWVAHMADRFVFTGMEPVVFFGILQAGSKAVSALVIGWSRRLRVNRQVSYASLILGLSAVLLVLLGGFAVSPLLSLSIVLFLAVMAVRELSYPIHTAWVNKGLDSSTRATMLSFSSQLDAVGQIGGGPIIGVLANQFSIQAGLLASAALLSPVFILSWILHKKGWDHQRDSISSIFSG